MRDSEIFLVPPGSGSVRPSIAVAVAVAILSFLRNPIIAAASTNVTHSVLFCSPLQVSSFLRSSLRSHSDGWMDGRTPSCNGSSIPRRPRPRPRSSVRLAHLVERFVFFTAAAVTSDAFLHILSETPTATAGTLTVSTSHSHHCAGRNKVCLNIFIVGVAL